VWKCKSQAKTLFSEKDIERYWLARDLCKGKSLTMIVNLSVIPMRTCTCYIVAVRKMETEEGNDDVDDDKDIAKRKI